MNAEHEVEFLAARHLIFRGIRLGRIGELLFADVSKRYNEALALYVDGPQSGIEHVRPIVPVLRFLYSQRERGGSDAE